MVKILPVSKYKLKGDTFMLDAFSIRRTIILLMFVISLIVSGLIHNRDSLIIEPTVVAYAPIKRIATKKVDKVQVALEKFISEHSDIDKTSTTEYAKLIVKYSKEHSVDPFLIVSLMKVESRFDRYAVSNAGALGLTQIMPRWHREKIKKMVDKFGYFNPFEPEHNIAIGTMIYAEYKQRSKGNRKSALLRYNGSLHHDAPTYANAVMKEFKAAKKWETKT